MISSEQKYVLITRAKVQSGDLVDLCVERGFVPVECPLIEIKSVDLLGHKKETNEKVISVFTSKNAIRPEVLEFCRGSKIATVGNETARKIREFGFEVDLIPSCADEKRLGEDICATYSSSDFKVDLYQGNTASCFLINFLSEKGFRVTKSIVYEVTPASIAEHELENFIMKALNESDRYFISLLSAYTAERFFIEVERILGSETLLSIIQKLNFIVLGAKAEAVVSKIGVSKILLAKEKSIVAVVNEVV